MTDLERHILELLLDNDCVIVPGFGGFMAHNLAASYNETDNVFNPPSRTIGFNPSLTMNDSLLAQSYVNCYEISYPEALRKIEQDVDTLKHDIEQEGGYTICGLGRIIMLEDGKYDFTPEASGLTAPYIYGFGSFEIHKLEVDENSKDADVVESKDKEATINDSVVIGAKSIFADSVTLPTPNNVESKDKSDKKEEIAVRIPINVIKHIAAACVVLFILLSFPAKLGEASTSHLKQTSIDTNLLYEIMPKDITSGKPKSLNNIQQVVSLVKSTNSLDDETAKVPTNVEALRKKASLPYYSIVLASRITKTNAQAYVEQLHKKGMIDANVYTSAGKTKIIYKKFSNLEEAQKLQRELETNSEFAGCWITEIK